MLQIKTIREDPKFIIERLKVKNFEGLYGYTVEETIENLLWNDKMLREYKQLLEFYQSLKNESTTELGKLYKKKDKLHEEISYITIIKKFIGLYDEIIEWKKESVKFYEERVYKIMILLPNIPHDSVPLGTSAKDNEVIYISPGAEQFMKF